MKIHNKVAWPALGLSVLTVVKACLIAAHVKINPDIETSATALFELVLGYLAPSGTITLGKSSTPTV